MFFRNMELLVFTHFTPPVKRIHPGDWKKGDVEDIEEDSAPPPVATGGIAE